MTAYRALAIVLSLAVAALLVPASASASTFSNPTPITIPTGAPLVTVGPAAPYPSTIAVSGVPGTVVKTRATLTGVSHSFPLDIDALLVGPGGQKTLLMSDVCGGTLTGQTFTFDDAASLSMPQFPNFCPSGTYKPTKFPGYIPTFSSPAPPGPQTTTAMSALNGSPAEGVWRLFVQDVGFGDTTGLIAGGWSLELLTNATCAGKAATMTGTAGPDQLTGTPGPDVILGFDGKDKISGLDGKDVECGGNGKDTLKGGKQKDILLGQGAKDKLKGGGGKDTCKGGKGNDSASACEVEKSI
jgi:hypothetical protein